VSYELLEAPILIAACHCKECQTLSSSAFSITAVVKASSVTFQGKMKDWIRLSDTSIIHTSVHIWVSEKQS
jgi:hypothetical protein